jgi:hypothetical protein
MPILELLWIAPKFESRRQQNADAVNYKYNTHSNPAKLGRLRFAEVSKLAAGGSVAVAWVGEVGRL